MGDLPPGVRSVHFNALSGLDRFKDVGLIISIGRTMPAPRDVENRAELIRGDAGPRVVGWYEKAPTALTMRDGRQPAPVYTLGGKGQDVTPGTDFHPDPVAEAVR